MFLLSAVKPVLSLPSVAPELSFDALDGFSYGVPRGVPLRWRNDDNSSKFVAEQVALVAAANTSSYCVRRFMFADWRRHLQTVV